MTASLHLRLDRITDSMITTAVSRIVDRMPGEVSSDDIGRVEMRVGNDFPQTWPGLLISGIRMGERHQLTVRMLDGMWRVGCSACAWRPRYTFPDSVKEFPEHRSAVLTSALAAN